jgi:hypothetical protein
MLTNTACICWFNVLEIAVCMFQKHILCFHSRFQSLWTYLTRTAKACVACTVLGGRSQSYGTTQRTAFSPSTWTRLREVLEVCRLSQLQAATEHRSFCFAFYWRNKNTASLLMLVLYYGTKTANRTAIRGHGRTITYNLWKCASGQTAD